MLTLEMAQNLVSGLCYEKEAVRLVLTVQAETLEQCQKLTRTQIQAALDTTKGELSKMTEGNVQVFASASKPANDDKPVGYWSDLLRGYELVNGIETPLLNRPQVEGREQELKDKWNAASAEDHAFVQKSVREQDDFIRKQTQL